jgi:beta-lactamase regulating signal transducer with metallopeptidase domain
MMNLPQALLPFAQALGWTVVHSVWQIGLIFCLYRLCTRVFNRSNQIAYGLGLSALGFIAVCFIGTFVMEYHRLVPEAEGNRATPVFETSALNPEGITSDFHHIAVEEETLWEVLDQRLEYWAPWIAWIWCLGACWMCVRLIAGYWLAQRLRYRGTFKSEAVFVTLCSIWAGSLGIRRPVQLLESKFLNEPVTLGFWKPVILFPAGMLLQLTHDQVEVLILHELAHIRRHDYIVNLLQTSLEACFFYHPLFWLLTDDIHAHREYCCDDMVVHRSNNRLLYAKTLTELKINNIHPQNAFTMTATKSFSTRIQRIAGIPPQRTNQFNLFFLTGILAVICSLTVWPLHSQAHPEEIVSGAVIQTNPNSTINHDTVPKPAKTSPKPASSQPIGSPVVALESIRMNILYIGMDNPLTIAVPENIKSDDLSVRLKGAGEIIKKGAGEFIARVWTPGTVIIEVYHLENEKETRIGGGTFRVKHQQNAQNPVSSIQEDGYFPYANPNPQGDVAIQVNQMNVLYEGINNPIRVAVSGVPVSEVHLRMKNGNGTVLGANGFFLAKVKSAGEAVIEVYRIQDGREKTLDTRTYSVKRIPDPVPYFAGHLSGEMELNQLTNDPSIRAILKDFDDDVSCDIVGYEITVMPKGEDPTTFTSSGNVLPLNALYIIKRMTPGSGIFLDNIKVKCPGDQSPRDIGGIAIKIKAAQ